MIAPVDGDADVNERFLQIKQLICDTHNGPENGHGAVQTAFGPFRI
jgi:hypothetical protein